MAEYQDQMESPECLSAGSEDLCEGTVEYHSIDGLSAWPRCEKHFDQRLQQYENSMERYARSDVAPSWFDPADAGERWDDDY